MKRPLWERRILQVFFAALLSSAALARSDVAWAQINPGDPGYTFPGAGPTPTGGYSGLGTYGGAAAGAYGSGQNPNGPGYSGYLPANPSRPTPGTRPSSWPGGTPDPMTPPSQTPRRSTAINPNAAPQYIYAPTNPTAPAAAPTPLKGTGYPGINGTSYYPGSPGAQAASAAYAGLVGPSPQTGGAGPPAAGADPNAPGTASPAAGSSANGSTAPGLPGAPPGSIGPGSSLPGAAGPQTASAVGPGASLPPRRSLLPSPFKTPTAQLENASGVLHFTGTEILARVGGDVILAGDVLPMIDEFLANRAKQQGKTLADYTQDELDQIRLPEIKRQLGRAIDTKVLFSAAKRDIAKDTFPKVEEHANKIFDENECKRLMEGYGVKTRGELDAKLHEYGASLEAARRAFFESGVGTQYLHQKNKSKEDIEITHDQLLEYYREHIKEYETPPRARWEQIQVKISNHDSKEEAYGILAGWGNQIVQGAPFAAVAKAHSEDISAADGGLHDWTTKGSLVSKPLDHAIFGLPVGSLSPIIEDEQGFSIVRVVERTELVREPFEEAQPDLKKKIKKERAFNTDAEFVAKLRAKTPIWTIFDAAGPNTAALAAPAGQSPR